MPYTLREQYSLLKSLVKLKSKLHAQNQRLKIELHYISYGPRREDVSFETLTGTRPKETGTRPKESGTRAKQPTTRPENPVPELSPVDQHAYRRRTRLRRQKMSFNEEDVIDRNHHYRVPPNSMEEDFDPRPARMRDAQRRGQRTSRQQNVDVAAMQNVFARNRLINSGDSGFEEISILQDHDSHEAENIPEYNVTTSHCNMTSSPRTTDSHRGSRTSHCEFQGATSRGRTLDDHSLDTAGRVKEAIESAIRVLKETQKVELTLCGEEGPTSLSASNSSMSVSGASVDNQETEPLVENSFVSDFMHDYIRNRITTYMTSVSIPDIPAIPHEHNTESADGESSQRRENNLPSNSIKGKYTER